MTEVKDYVRFLGKLESRLVVSKLGQCWEWQGSTNRRKSDTEIGYGMFWYQGNIMLAHRWSWEYLGGNEPPGELYVLHKCDNPLCCNPEHLFLGTQADNAADRVSKGRSACGASHGLRLHPEAVSKGEDHYLAKLDECQVRFIRQLYALPEPYRLSQTDLAELFKISLPTMNHIVHRRLWKHI